MNEFDTYAHDYESALERGIAISGENATFFARQRLAWLDQCLRQMRFTANTVLDYGCGTGTATPFLLEMLKAQSVIGVDLSIESLNVARREHHEASVDFRSVDDHTPDGSIDLAVCNGVFHHVPETERRSVAKYIAACLRPGGVFALWENNPWSPGARYVMSRIPFDRDAVMVWPRQARDLVDSVGLRVIQTDFHFVFPSVLSCFRRMEPHVRQLPFGAQYQVICEKPSE